ncbi:MAG: HAD family hydrolase [Pseudomonadales bacterium]|nr:HAD family hydrolase [Pseudomonadales bacterium]
MPKPIELIIFDCDGVLVDSELIANQVLQQGLASLGWTLSLAEVMQRFMGKSLASCEGEIAAFLNTDIPQAFWTSLQQTTYARFRADLQPVAGIVEVLDVIKQPKCVASSGSHEKINTTLGITGLKHHFNDAIYSATSVDHGKPAPDLFLYAAQQMQTDPSACLVIEDSPYGVQAARAADMRVLGYCALTPKERMGAIPTFNDMSTLPTLISKLQNIP